MRTIAINHRRFAGFCILLLAAALASFGFAQTQPAAQQARMMMDIQVRPGMELEWETLLKNDVFPALKKSGTNQWDMWKTAVFGEDGHYIWSFPAPPMAQLDQPHPLLKALGPAGMAMLMTRLQRLIIGSRTFVLTSRADLSITPKADYAMKLGVQIASDVAPGRSEEFEKNAKPALAVLGKTNIKGLLTGRVGMGGNPNQYYMLALFDGFSDLMTFMPAFAKASAEAKLAPQPAGVVTHEDVTTFIYAPELSQAPAQP